MLEKTLYLPPVETHFISSSYVDQAYQIQVMQPLMEKGEHPALPVLYLTDGNENFDVAKGIALSLQAAGLVRQFILVGIGYPSDNPFAGDILRARDLTPKRRPEIPGFPRQSPIEGVPGIEDGKKNWQGADEFLEFIQRELMPLIESRYATQPGERAYFGHSFGGGFGIHALFSRIGLFNSYIVSSPGVLWEGDPHGIEPAERFIASGQQLNARLFMSIGGEEEFEPAYARSQFCTGFYRLAGLLHRAQVRGLVLTVRQFAGETHASVWPIAFSHGVRDIFGTKNPPEPTAPVES